MDNVLALIPARGGSKGLPRKNVRLMAGKPLITWTIETALAAGLPHVVVSTEDEEIAAVSRQAGAAVPFLRPADLASDTASSLEVALHALDNLGPEPGRSFEWLLLLQPTSPLRTAADLFGALELQRARAAVGVVSVCQAAHPPHWLRRLGPQGEMLTWRAAGEISQRQEAAPLYQLNGALYLVKADALRAQRTFFPSGTYGYVMPVERSIDIDTGWDFHLAELILKEQREAAQPDR